MTTTALIVEMVIIGLQGAIWLTMLVALVSDYNASTLLQNPNFEKLMPVVAVVGFGVSYTLGVIVDAFTAYLEVWYEKLLEKILDWVKILDEREFVKKFRNRHVPIDPDERRMLRQKLRIENPEATKDLDNEQYRLRLLRSTAFNLIIIAILGIMLTLRGNSLPTKLKVTYTVVFVGLAAIGYYSWRRRLRNYRDSRRVIYSILREKSLGTPSVPQGRKYPRSRGCGPRW